MNLDRFLRERRPDWAELDALLRRSGRRPQRLGAERVRRVGALYRRAVADVALARRTFPGDPVTLMLEDLVARARRVVYQAESRRQSLRHFVATGYWRRVRERPVLVLAAAISLLLPAVLGTVWGLTDAASAGGMVPDEYRAVTEPRPRRGLGLSLGESANLSSLIFTNNIRISFFAFAGGIAAGLLTAAVLVFNGVFLGVLAGLAWQAGNGLPFVELVAPHGVLELSCIVVAGAAGLRLGWSLVDPGHRRRAEAVVEEGRAAVEVALGTAVCLVVAGLVEGFLTPADLGWEGALSVGLVSGALYWALVIWRGRPQPIFTEDGVTVAPAPSS
jgi:uncharacterized membrane protein SpoIIM required for sporulation